MTNIHSVQPGPGKTLMVTWKGGARSMVDVSRHLAAYAIFAPVRTDDELFRSVSVGEWGWCAHWSDEMEISADTLWRLALEKAPA